MNKTTYHITRSLAITSVALGIASCDHKDQSENNELALNFGCFPNVTHVQGLVARHFSRTGEGWFEKRINEQTGKNVKINWYTYNAGPSAMEAIFANSIEVTYVGPGPAINAFVKSKGDAIRIISGSAEGGAALVVPQDSALQTPLDFKGKAIATPQLGNTQDVAARAWFTNAGLHVTQTGGDVTILPTPNPEQVSLFKQGKLAGVWTVEPWVSRLELQAGGKVLVDEDDALITVLAASKKFIDNNPELTVTIVRAHRELTEWIKENPEEARKIVIEELKDLTRSGIEQDIIERAWKRIRLTDTILTERLQDFARKSYAAGFVKEEPDLTEIVARPNAQ